MRYTKKQLAGFMRELAESTGRVPTQVEMNIEPGMPAQSTYIRRFGSWRAAHEAAGLEPNPSNAGSWDRTLKQGGQR